MEHLINIYVNLFQYIDEFDIDLVNQALTFNTTDMHIQGTCDLFTTKPIGADRKLYKTLNKLYNNSTDDIEATDKTERQNSNTSIASSSEYELNEAFVQLKKRSFSYTYSNAVPIQQQLIENCSNKYNFNKVRSKSFNSPSPPLSLTQKNVESNAASDSNDGFEKSPFGPLSQSSSRKLFGYLIAILNATYPDHDFSTIQPRHFTLLNSPADLTSKVNNFLISVGKSTGLDWVWETINTHIDLDSTLCFQFEPQESFLNDFPGVLWCNMYFMFNKKKKRVAFLYFMATVLKEDQNDNGLATGRRNSKIGTLDEERVKLGENNDEEYDLRYSNNGPIYEDVFEEEDDEIDHEGIEEEHENIKEEEIEEDSEEDYEMDQDALANENQDDEDLI